MEAREARLRTQMQRSPVMLHPLFGVLGIRRESGDLSRYAMANAINATWAWGLERRTQFTNQSSSLTTPRDIITFARDDATGVFVYGLSGAAFEDYNTVRCVYLSL